MIARTLSFFKERKSTVGYVVMLNPIKPNPIVWVHYWFYKDENQKKSSIDGTNPFKIRASTQLSSIWYLAFQFRFLINVDPSYQQTFRYPILIWLLYMYGLKRSWKLFHTTWVELKRLSERSWLTSKWILIWSMNNIKARTRKTWLVKVASFESDAKSGKEKFWFHPKSLIHLSLHFKAFFLDLNSCIAHAVD